ncbi:MAG: DedA family protein [Rubrobacter sp.]|nr:DedA family protein [Rubrobacter sp.]
MINDLFTNLAQWVVELVYSFGYTGVFVLIALINLHLLPLPTQLILSLAGFLVGQGRFSLVLVLMASTAGGLAASLALYFLGLWIGEENLHRLIGRLECFKLVYRSDLHKASKVFERHGGKAIVIGHLVPAVGALISIPAGLKRMPLLRQFVVYTVVGSGLWNATFITLGWVLGTEWVIIEQYAPLIEYTVLTTLIGGALWFVWHRRKAHKYK